MEQEQLEKEVARRSAFIYLPITFGMMFAFFLAASLADGYPPVAKIGGMIWVGLLSLIISMPIITSRVKRSVQSR